MLIASAGEHTFHSTEVAGAAPLPSGTTGGPWPSGSPSRRSDSFPVKEDTSRTRRDIRAAIIFGVIAATIELGVLIYFFR